MCLKVILLYVFGGDFVCAKNTSAPGPIVKPAQSSTTSSAPTKQTSTTFNATAVENVERPKDTKAFIATLPPSAQQELGVIKAPAATVAGLSTGSPTLQFNRSAIAAPYIPPTQTQTIDHTGKSSPSPIVQPPASSKISSSDSSLSSSPGGSSSKSQGPAADVSSSSSNKNQTTSTDSQSKSTDTSSAASSKDQATSTDSQSKSADSSSASSSKSQTTSTSPTTSSGSTESTTSQPTTNTTPSVASPPTSIAAPAVSPPAGLTITQQIFSIVNTQNISQQVQQGAASTTASTSSAAQLLADQTAAWNNFDAAFRTWLNIYNSDYTMIIAPDGTTTSVLKPDAVDPGPIPNPPNFPDPRPGQDPYVGFVGGQIESSSSPSDTFITKKGDTTFWGQAMLSRDKQRTRKGDPGYKSMGRGFIAGFDKDISANKTFGMSGSVNQVVVKPDQSTSKNIVNTYLAITNFTQNLQFASVFGSIFGGVNRNKTENLLTQSYSYTSKMEGLSVGISKPFQWSAINMSPSLSTTGTLVQQNAYRDDARNYHKSQATRSLMSSASFAMSYTIQPESNLSHTLNLAPGLSFNHTIKPKSISIDTGSGLIQVQPNNQPRLSYAVTSGYKFSKNNLSCDLNYGLQLKSKFVGHSLSMKIGQKF